MRKIRGQEKNSVISLGFLYEYETDTLDRITGQQVSKET